MNLIPHADSVAPILVFTLLKDVPLRWPPESLVKSPRMSVVVPALGKGVLPMVVILLLLLCFGHSLSLGRTQDFQNPFVSSSRRHISTLPAVQSEGSSPPELTQV